MDKMALTPLPVLWAHKCQFLRPVSEASSSAPASFRGNSQNGNQSLRTQLSQLGCCYTKLPGQHPPGCWEAGREKTWCPSYPLQGLGGRSALWPPWAQLERLTWRYHSVATRRQHQCARGRKSPLGYLICVLLTGALLDRAVAGQVMHDAVVDLRVKPHGRGCHVLQR